MFGIIKYVSHDVFIYLIQILEFILTHVRRTVSLD